MSTITKVFIVLQLVFSIALGTMAIVIAGQTHNWKALAEQYQARAQAASTLLTQSQGRWAVEKAQLADQIKSQAQELLRRQEQLEQRLAELDQTKAALAEQRLKNASLSASLTKVSKSLDVELARADRLEQRNNELLATATDLQRRNLDLNERVNELTTNVVLLQQQVRALQQQRYGLEQQLASLQQRLKRAGVPGAPPTVVEPSPERVRPLAPAVTAAIRGRIEQISGNIAQISVGSADGVTEGMVFVIYRDGNYLGKVTVEEVDDNRAAGTLSSVQGQIRVGDKVADEARFGLVR